MKTAHSTANGARHANGDSLTSARSWLQNGAVRARQKATDAASRADGYAHESPWRVAGYAAVVGLALGVMVARR